ncbi:MAG: glycine cleavage system protein GcvH [Candidatus Latescibacteria bacterium]|nr:glycine cleavage system protein GcvH [Candidatus Latescibacterota bacterium]NIO27314.1 glycine cleavage system protein GcvH [Candidatus Latescibacterota bacterium]NIO54838.1 glycine cleavage system protein GcvH [Candidatus Latescibacterota bacterium]NIT00921.1 glycine cleavage system protein GcvH [Candidatus Latescibacterota bacterium]NIT37844.1 glycine cleavage system protein GcvH [Candidatus Latescibacterota bacterium]
MDVDKMRFSKEHEWVAAEGSDKMATVGITEYAAGELGDIVYIELPEEGTEVKFMEPMGTIEAVKTVADLYAPISGAVKEVNKKLEDEPELTNQSPYGEGWFIKVEMSDPSELEKLMSHEEYQEMIGKE